MSKRFPLGLSIKLRKIIILLVPLVQSFPFPPLLDIGLQLSRPILPHRHIIHEELMLLLQESLHPMSPQGSLLEKFEIRIFDGLEEFLPHPFAVQFTADASIPLRTRY
jgi:hypothetical protein